jgi:sec-independent protein translocase protein TatC
MRRFFNTIWRIIAFPFKALWWLVTLPVRLARRASDFLKTEPEERPLGDVLPEVFKQPASIFEHIEALRKHLLRALLGLALMVVISFIFTQRIIDFLAGPIGGIQALKAIDVTETIGVFMRVALLSGFALATPYIVFELWLFIAPALHPRVKITSLLSIPMVALLFIGGMAFAYLILLPSAMKFLLNFMGITVIPRPSSYIGFITGVLFWVGVAFEFPLIIYILTIVGMVKPSFLAKNWRIAVVIIAILAAAITPTVDPVNMGLVMGPMVLLYFIGLGLSFLAAGGRTREKLRQG